MSNGFNEDWTVEEMITLNGFAIEETVQNCGWMVQHGMVCGTLVKTKDLNAHLRACHGVNAEAALHQCFWYGCNVPPMTRSSLERHVKESHVRGTWACPCCPTTFTRKSNLRNHLNTNCPFVPH
ncbi:hypothetical protein PAXRUDRAFT_562512 [Paxillus rubicundulus Ve08.2h10]|uniref:C2H2-type domain-containing protein n=1 Tax=Paxillus rubicundulus Ve08.2h10 TaxID=930991 RepID=A0A0D0E599_9AGAM|nr:hypothetical protein PAXRUDRAFT_562512 [Paxillus rubicundulus Ve08.2h10]